MGPEDTKPERAEEPIGLEEIADPRHLPLAERKAIALSAKAAGRGIDVHDLYPDDPEARALVHGEIMLAAGTDLDEPGYTELYPRIESITVNQQIETLVRELYPATMAALVDGKMWCPENPREGDVRPPTLEETIAILSSRLTPEQIKFALERMKKGQIILKPATAFSRYAQMLDTGKKLNGTGWTQQPTFVSPNRASKFAAEDQQMQLTGDRITGWEVGIGEGADIDAQSGILRDLLTKWQGELPQGVVIASPKEQALLQKLGIMTGKPMDKKTWTPCRSDLDGIMIGDDGLVAGGLWIDDRPVFDGNFPGAHYARAVLRPVVMAKRA